MSKQTRTMAIDFGQKRIGVAVSDPLGITAQPLPFVANAGYQKSAEAVAAICRERQVSEIVVGLPRHMNGDEGDSAKLARRFGDALEAATSLPVIYLDERLTSKAVDRMMLEADLSRKKRRERIDSAAAAMILRDYLASRSGPKMPPMPPIG